MKKNVYKNWYRYLLVTLLSLTLVAGLYSCGDDNEDNEPEVDLTLSLIGAWKRDIGKPDTPDPPGTWLNPWKTILTFESNGKLSFTTFINGSLDQGGGIGDGVVTGEYYYVVDKNIIKLGSMTESDFIISCTILYKIEGDNLNLEYVSGTKPRFIFYPNNVNEVSFNR